EGHALRCVVGETGSSHPSHSGSNAAFFVENEPLAGVESGQARSGQSIVLARPPYLETRRALRSVIGADVDLSHGLDRAPDADKARLHHKAVTGAVRLRRTAVFLNFDDTRDDVAKLVGGALDGM